ncbi:MAG: hypothetical protein ICV52_12745 [Microcoleus sp. C1-bin4]|nr:hypothetical protein [Microcoleus sp. C1-bin4]
MARAQEDFSLALRHSPVSHSKVSGCVFALMLQPQKNLAETSLTLDNSYSIRNLCFVHELQQTTTNFCGWGSLRSRFSPNPHQIFSELSIIKCFTCSAYSRLSDSRKLYKA